MRRKLLLSPLLIIVLLAVFGIGVAGAAVYFGGAGGTEEVNLQKGLMGWWKFDGNAKDSTPNSNHATVYGAVLTTDRKGQANKAYVFNSANSEYIDAGNSPTLDPGTGEFSAVVWAKTSTKAANEHIISKMKNGSNWPGYTMYIQESTGYLLSELRANGVDYNTQVNVDYADSNWHLFVLTVVPGSATGKNLYVDGVLKATTDVSTLSSVSTTNSLFIGKYRDASSYFTGSIDDVRYYNRAISQAEVTALYQSYDPGIVVSDLQKGLVGNWKLNGNPQDSSPYSNHGTVTGAVLTTDRKGQANKAYTFNGSSDYVSVTDSASLDLSVWTIETWFQTSASGAEGTIVAKGVWDGPSSNYVLQITAADKLRGFFGYTTGWSPSIVDSPSTVNDGNWHQGVFTYNGSQTKLYLDGVNVATTEVSQTPSQNNYTLTIGRWSSDGTPFNGSIDNVRIHSRALSQAEITALYQSYDPGIVVSDLQKGLAGHWKFDGNAKDSTPNSNHGTVTGATLTIDRKGQVNKAYNFNGSSDYVGAGSGASLGITNDITIEAWINTNQLINYTPIANKLASGYYGYRFLFISNGVLRFAKANTDGTLQEVQSTSGITAGVWYHVAVTKNATSVSFYINGKNAGNATLTSDGIRNNTYALDIGRNQLNNVYFNGSIDDVRIYNRALSQAEITALYESY